jgi:hypothetical protein
MPVQRARALTAGLAAGLRLHNKHGNMLLECPILSVWIKNILCWLSNGFVSLIKGSAALSCSLNFVELRYTLLHAAEVVTRDHENEPAQASKKRRPQDSTRKFIEPVPSCRKKTERVGFSVWQEPLKTIQISTFSETLDLNYGEPFQSEKAQREESA